MIGVASGKGGVGKSTVSVNLALALASMGTRVGLLDADVYGPTVPLLLGLSKLPPQRDVHHLLPAEAYGIQVMSMGLISPSNEAIIWRGPMLHKMITQLTSGVEWGVLDYLIVDLPPGTGDVQLSLAQVAPLAGAVIVSTPQDAALAVATRAIDMLRQMNLPVLGLIENMSPYRCPHCGHEDAIFGFGGVQRVSEELELAFLGRIPLSNAVRESADLGVPVLVSQPDSEESRAFLNVAANLSTQLTAREPIQTQAVLGSALPSRR